MSISRTLPLLALVIGNVAGFAGCAKVVVKPATAATEEGLHFYRPRLYLQVFKDDKGICSAKVLPLPDYSQEWLVRAEPGVGSASAEATLTDGWNLTALSGEADSKTAEIITAVGSAAGSMAAMAAPKTSSACSPAEGLYVVLPTDAKSSVIKLQKVSIDG
ncbi:MAG: hypothetical protein U0Q04_10165 [Microbacterium sp.]